MEPVLKVIEKPCDLILKHMAVCFVSSRVLGGREKRERVETRTNRG